MQPGGLSGSAMRNALFAVMSVALSLLVCLLAVEIVLRFLPVATGLWTLPVNEAQPVFRFSPNRDFLFSRDWNFSLVNRGRINNDGFVNDQDYVANDRARCSPSSAIPTWKPRWCRTSRPSTAVWPPASGIAAASTASARRARR